MTRRAKRLVTITLGLGIAVCGMGGAALGVPKKGDLTADGVVDARDVLKLQRFLKGDLASLTTDERNAADVAPVLDCGAMIGDNTVDEADLAVLVRAVSGFDVDGDGVTAAIENRMAVEYPSQLGPCGTSPFQPPGCFLYPDTDGDGLNLPSELLAGTNPTVADTDGDGLKDGLDNQGLTRSRDPACSGCAPFCLASCHPADPQFLPLSSPLNPDTDGDSVTDGNEDFDGDGLTNITEQGLGSNIFAADSDNDSLSDAFEANTFGTSPKSIDSNCDQVLDKEIDGDGDGLGYNRELALGTNPALADTDGDGVTDGREIDLCTNPLAPDASGTAFCVNRIPSAAMDWKVFQREASNTAFVPVQFGYRSAAPVELEARVVDVA